MSRKLEISLVILLAGIAITLNILPFIKRLTTTPKDRAFLGTQFYSLDYNIYLGHFKEGAEGTFRIHDKHTSEDHLGFVLRREYWLWGLLTGKLLQLPIWAVYHSARITAGTALVALIYVFINKLTINKIQKISALASVLFIAGLTRLTNNSESPDKLGLYLEWILELDPANRLATLFHYLIGNITLLLSLIIFTSNKTQRLTIPILVILGWIAGLVHPPTLATMYITFAIFILLLLLQNVFTIPSKLIQNIQKYIKIYIIFLIFTLPVVSLLKAQTSTFPWDQIARWDRETFAYIPFIDYIKALGPNLALSLPFLVLTIASLNQSRPLLLMLASFTITHFLWLFVLYPLLPDINRQRFTQTPIFVPLGIFASLSIYSLTKFLLDHTSKKLNTTKLASPITLAVVIILVLYTFPALKKGLDKELYMFSSGDLLIHTPKDLYFAYQWLDQNTKPDEVVLATFYSATLLPGQSGNTSYWGHPWSTVDFAQKEAQVNRFFRNQMSIAEAREFLSRGNIDFVLHDFQSQLLNFDPHQLDQLLTPVFTNSSTTIFKVTL